jgi:hypothetical protein
VIQLIFSFFIVFWIFLVDDDGLGINVILGWQQDALVLCKIFQKSGTGPKNGKFSGDYQQPIIGTGETSELHHYQEFVDIPEQDGMDANPLRDDFFIEAKDLSDPIGIDPADFGMADKFLNLDMDEGFDPSDFFGD